VIPISEQPSSESTSSPPSPQRKKMKLEDKAERLFDKKIVTPETSYDAEFASYLLEPIISRMDNPLLWWKIKKSKYPILAQIAKKMLAIQATSTPSERLWSKAGELCSAKRSRLGAKLLDKILFCNHNMKVLKK